VAVLRRLAAWLGLRFFFFRRSWSPLPGGGVSFGSGPVRGFVCVVLV